MIFWNTLKIAMIAMINMHFSSAASLTTIDASEIQRFELAYEEWVQNLAHSVAPEIPNTVLVEINYSNNPVDIQNYEEIKASSHLPGLPDVTDPNINHPSESPVSALVSKQQIKIIFESALNANQQRILNEVLRNKLKLNLARGDSLNIESLEAAPKSPATQNTQLNVNPSNRNTQTLVFTLFAIICAAMMIAFNKNRKNKNNQSQNQQKVSRDTISVQAYLKQKHPLLFAKTNLILNPTQLILRSNPKILIEAVRKESAKNLAAIVSCAPESMAALVLNACNDQQRVEIRKEIILNGKNITKSKGQYQQMILAAKIHHLQKQGAGITTGKSGSPNLEIRQMLNQFSDAQSQKVSLREKMRNDLQRIRNSIRPQKQVRNENREANL